ncbi:helicase [Seminavis robusta]|uniref:Helicase n=1 Tax=Seminavis robusta TaxID=568900 RepID=A0A9N8EC19_9STRA|nr:helicase [Seminavis robusta]|eukprot:Sro870_g213740.1 helicase (296) ;mRNA; r:40955-41842
MLGFDFLTPKERHDQRWRARYERLKVFKSIFGHTRVPRLPRKWDNEEMKPWCEALGTWVMCQRTKANTLKMLPWRKTLLNDIGFEYSIMGSACKCPADDTEVDDKMEESSQDSADAETEKGIAEDTVSSLANYSDANCKERAWFDQYNRLVNFRNEKAHAVVPYYYKEDPNFARWVAKQRHFPHQNRMRPNRKRLLNELGFIWDATRLPWEEQFERVVQFKKENKYLEIPHDNQDLWFWLWSQKNKACNGELAHEHAQKLSSIGIELGDAPTCAITPRNDDGWMKPNLLTQKRKV